MVLKSYVDYLAHWNSDHVLSEAGLRDIECQVKHVRHLENNRKSKECVLLSSVTNSNNELNPWYSKWKNRQRCKISYMDKTLRIQKQVLSTMLTHLHFYRTYSNLYYYGKTHMSLQNTSENFFSTLTTDQPKESHRTLIIRALSESDTAKMSRREIAKWLIDGYNFFKEMDSDKLLQIISYTLSRSRNYFTRVGNGKWKLEIKKMIKDNKL